MIITIDTAFASILQYGYFVIFPTVVLEGPIITVIVGFLLSQGHFSFFIAYPLIVIGDLVGDVIYYFIGKHAKKYFLHKKSGSFLGITKDRLFKLENHFTHHSGKTLLIGKLTQSVGWAVLIGAGAAEMPIGRFLWYNFIGTLPKSLAFLLLGYYFGYAYRHINAYMDRISLVVCGLVIIGIVVYVFKKRKTKPLEIKTDV